MDYEKESIIVDISDSERKYQLIDCIISTRNDLKKAHKNFEYAEEDLIDFYSYQIKALQSKLDYLTRVAKEKNINFKFSNEKVI